MELPSHLLPTALDRRYLAEFARSSYSLVLPRGVTAEMVEQPEFWIHVAPRLKVFDRLELIAEDGSFDMDVRVLAIDPRGQWAQVRVLRSYSGHDGIVPSTAGADKDGYLVEFDKVQRWRIFRGTELVAKDFATEADAREALHNLKAVKPRPKAAA